MRYGKNDVLNGVSFNAQRGEVLVMLGPNGAGKSTTLEILEGFRLRSSGSVTVLGTDPADGDEQWRARIGVVLQSWRDHGRWRVGELLDYLGKFYAPFGTGSIERPWDVAELLKLVGLTEHASKKISSLSGGQRRRMDVAIGIVGKPEVLFLDEPTAGFDPDARRGFHDLVHRLADLEGTTIVVTTHDLDEAEKLADRIVVLGGGRIIADGSPDDLARGMPADSEVRWSLDGRRSVHSTTDSAKFIHDLYVQHGDRIVELEVRRSTLEDSYMALVHQSGSPVHVVKEVAK
nr:ABC transporter ATP-binding protein [Rhodococcus sp. (in: high G+C Gram-positive bacteria)]